ncbi:MAG: TIM-barrel domain-containing protein [Chloroflexota bacterium]
MASLREAVMLIRSSGLGQTLRVLSFTLHRERLERKYRRTFSNQETAWQTPGGLQSTEATLNGARFRFERAELVVDFLATDLARLSWEPGTPPVPYALAKTDWAGVQTSLEKAPEGNRLASQALQILVKPDGGVQFATPAGNILRQELPPRLRGAPEMPTWQLEALLEPREHLYGLGEQAGPFNLRGAIRRMWNTDPGGSYGPQANPLYMPVPVYMGLHPGGSYLIFHENSFPATFDFRESCQVTFEGGALRTYFIPGPPERALQRYTQLTGRPELPPLWSLGYHQSRWGYLNEADILEVVAGFTQHDLPLSAIHLDIDYMRGFRVFTVDPQRFPDLKSLAKRLQDQDIRLVTIIDPGVKQDRNYEFYKDGNQQGRFCMLPNGRPAVGVVWPGKSVFPDFTDAKTRAWWGEGYRQLLEAGVAGIWHDMNEPTSFAAWGGNTLPSATRHKLEGHGGDHRQAHNLYGLMMNRAGHEALHQLRPERRPWIISRAGWASQQRYAWNWTGDCESTWGSLRMSIASILGQGLSGLPYTGPDIGGFSGSPSAELYLRWFQLATFLPFFRTHSALTTARREPWVYGEPYTDIIRQFLRLRYRLLPYLYTLAWQTSQTGFPLVRPLFWTDANDQALWDIDDAFLLGEALLIAPVLEESQEQRSLQLPGGNWYNLWDDQVLTGSKSVELPTNLETIPVLVRAGSLLPLAEKNISTQSAGTRMELHLYPPEEGHIPAPQLLYSDAGDGYGESRLERFQVRGSQGEIEVTWQGEGEFPFPYDEIEVHLHGYRARRAWIDERPAEMNENRLQTGIFQHIRFEA